MHVCRVRGKLSQSVERVTALEASHAQQRLDWEGRNREAERVTYSKQEEALHQLEETKKEVSYRDAAVHAARLPYTY